MDKDRSPLEVIEIYEHEDIDPTWKHSNTMLKYCNLYNRMKWTVEDIEDGNKTRT
jgi:hypothetical protein